MHARSCLLSVIHILNTARQHYGVNVYNIYEHVYSPDGRRTDRTDYKQKSKKYTKIHIAQLTLHRARIKKGILTINLTDLDNFS